MEGVHFPRENYYIKTFGKAITKFIHNRCSKINAS